MSKGTNFIKQSYIVSDTFPFKWINKKWKEGFFVTSMAAAGSLWAIVMSRGSNYSDQVVELDFRYPNEGRHQRWNSGYRITATAARVIRPLLFSVCQGRSLKMNRRRHFVLLLFLVHMSGRRGRRTFILHLSVMDEQYHKGSDLSLGLLQTHCK
ncbi:hypothetical protein RchiOBHm_Chr7g0187401 [Rosa chinensis]|uniref:DUF7477 domain-containing protein n=1 Tax=Rosa chinensis TaxID=74649 RepID=A0A2P6P466_ROSCH|nr:hypothetical protein RchiOBHm_Chr7g0187401 [Rosa chinensis]